MAQIQSLPAEEQINRNVIQWNKPERSEQQIQCRRLRTVSARQASSMAYLRTEGQTGVQFKEVYQGIERDSMAYKLMSSMGWQEGEGLGAQKQGINVHVRAHKKFDTKGVGMKEQAARMQDWTLDMCKFSAVLKGLKEITAPEGPRPADADDEHLALQPTNTTASPKPEKEVKSQKRKKRARADETAETLARLPSPSSELSKQQNAKHATLYTRRRQHKQVKGYSATDIAAILGHAPEAVAAAPVIAPITAGAPQPEIPNKKVKKSKNQPERDLGNTQCPIDTPQEPLVNSQKTTSSPVLPVESEESWWNTLFTRVASVGSANNQGIPAAKRTAFCEQDQTALYTSAHADKSQGRKGLGSKSAKLKASQWQGKKVSFESDEEQEGQQDGSEEEAEEPADVLLAGNRDYDQLPGGTVVVWGGQRPEWFVALRNQQQQADSSLSAPAQPASDEFRDEARLLSEKQRRKCLKVACKMLKKYQGGVKLKEVVDSALAALNVSQSMDKGKLRSKVKTVIKKGDGWSIQGGKLLTAVPVSS